ncbi:methyl-accepting chemotaxis protein [Undibacterium sp. Ji83W]|uniref:methyl-accepting chemotaxis protein n=1 Tax=Undibacterium sp. Ji83W TaxID=3413043 RepID=UPI003BF344CB
MKTMLKTKFMLVMGIMSAFMILVGLTGLYAMRASQQSFKNHHEEHTQGLEKITSIDKLLSSNRYAILAALADPIPAKLQISADEIERDKRAIDQLWTEFVAMPMSTETRKKADELTHLRASFDHAVTLPAIQALHDADTRKAKEISLLAEQLKDPVISAMNSLRSMQLDLAKKEYESAQAGYAALRNLMLAAIALGLVLAAALAYFLVHIMYRQLGGEPAYAAQLAMQIADGDLDVSITPVVHEEASLLASLQQLQTGLIKAVKDMRLNSGNIARTSGQILSNNIVLSSRIQQQTGLHKQITLATKELTSAMRHNGEQARQAMQHVDDASDFAVKSGQAASGAVTAMTQIRQASDKIFDNIHVIDELVFQIDTLTLKATLEDANASDAGQRFTAIAPEVRDLALCVACAVKEVKKLLNESREKLDDGSKLISQSNVGTEQMLAAMQDINSLMEEINTSAKKQEASIRQIKHAVSDMDYANRKDAVLLGVATTATKLLEQQATHLAQIGSGFKLGTTHRPQTQLQVVGKVAPENALPKRPNLRLVRP